MLAHDYDRHDRDFELYRARDPQRVQEIVDAVAEASGVAADRLVRHHDFLRGFTYARMVEAWRPQWLHSYFFYERSLYSLIAAWLLGIPRGVSSYADHLLQDYEFKVVPLHLRQCDLVVATSARIKRELLSLAPDVDPDKIIVKPNAIDAKHFPVVERPQPGAGQPWRLVCVARIEPKKGQLHLIEAVHALNRDRSRNVELHLIGEPDKADEASQRYSKQVRDYCQANGLLDTVHFEGRRSQDEVRRFLGDAQLFVAPFVETDTGDKDGIPTALLEAMATGVAIVVTDAGSMLEVITDGTDGVVVPQRDAKALADAIEPLLLDADRRRVLGRAAAERVRREFDVSVCELRLHQRIDAILAARGA
jgi:glycosyltransferase involved in cell wall biosynthesis